MASVAQVVDGKIVNNGVSAAEKEASSEPKKPLAAAHLAKTLFYNYL